MAQAVAGVFVRGMRPVFPLTLAVLAVWGGSGWAQPGSQTREFEPLPTAEEAVQRLLAIAWTDGTTARVELDRRFAEWSALGARVRYAYVLGAMRQRRYSTADEALRPLVGEATGWEVWRTKSWLSLVNREFDAAGRALEHWALKLPAVVGGDPLGIELAEELGRCVGYLEGPAQRTLAAQAAERVAPRILAALAGERVAAFERGRNQVADSFVASLRERDRESAEAKSRDVEERAERTRNLEEERAGIDRRQAEIEEESSRLRSEAVDQSSELARADVPLRDQLVRLDSQAALLARELRVIDADAARLQSLLVRERDPYIRGQIELDLGRLSALAARYEGDLLVVQRQMNSLGFQRQQLAAQGAAIQADLNSQLGSKQEQLSESERRARRIEAEKNRLARKTGPQPSAANASLAAIAGALTTYFPYPLDAERAKLLAAAPR